MGLKAYILDGLGRGRKVAVTPENALQVANIFPDVPPQGTKNRFRYYSVLLGSTGADGGTVNMAVDGSVTPQEFFVASEEEFDIHISSIAIVIADTGITHDKFGGIAALGVGWDLVVTESGEDTFVIDKAQTGGGVIAQSGLREGIGNAATSWELTKFSGVNDATIVVIPVSEYIPEGIRIGRGTKDRITSIVNDDLTGLFQFEVRLLGYRHFPGDSG